MPDQPLGANPFQNDGAATGDQLWKSKKRRPIATKKQRITSLIATMIALKRLDSFTPTTNSQVSASTISTANRLKTIGVPNRCGADARISGVAPFGQTVSHRGTPQSHSGWPAAAPTSLPRLWTMSLK